MKVHALYVFWGCSQPWRAAFFLLYLYREARSTSDVTEGWMFRGSLPEGEIEHLSKCVNLKFIIIIYVIRY